jgi:hypothetical protein
MQQIQKRIPEFTEQCEHLFGSTMPVPRTAAQQSRIAQDRGEIEQAAAYVADLSADLAKIARGHSLGMLGDILDLAHLEAKRSMKLARR